MTATILKSSPRYKAWLEVFGTSRVEVLDPKPRINFGGPGQPFQAREAGRFYQIDVAALSAMQKQRLIIYISRSWKVPVSLVQEWLSDSSNGIPLIASDVVVAMGLFS